MYAALDGQVYLMHAGSGESSGGSEEWLLLSDEGEYAPVVIRIRVEIEDAHAGSAPDRVGYARDLHPIAALAKVRYGFEKLGRHRILS
jgi:hypothetical protein